MYVRSVIYYEAEINERYDMKASGNNGKICNRHLSNITSSSFPALEHQVRSCWETRNEIDSQPFILYMYRWFINFFEWYTILKKLFPDKHSLAKHAKFSKKKQFEKKVQGWVYSSFGDIWKLLSNWWFYKVSIWQYFVLLN